MSFDVSLRGPSGFNVDLQDAGGGAYNLTVDTSAVTLTGSSIVLRRALRLSVSTMAITLNGSEIGLTYTPAVTTRRGDDAASYGLTGEARNAIYARQLEDLEDELETAPRPGKRKEKAKRIREIVLKSDEPVFTELAAEITPVLDQFTAQEIDWQALVHAIEAQIKAAQRKRRHRHIAIAMLMAA